MPEATLMSRVMDGLMEIHGNTHAAMSALGEEPKPDEALAAIKLIDARLHSLFMAMKDDAP